MINKVILVGSLGKDPESRFFASGDQQVTVSMATSRRWKDKQTGERKEKTSWHNLVFNGGLAKVAADYLKKGSKVYVEGEIDYRDWEKDGVKHYMTQIVVTQMHMMDSRNDSEGAQQSRPQAQAQVSKPPEVFEDSDIPF